MASFPSDVQPSQAHPEPKTPAAVVANWAFISSIDPKASSIAFASCFHPSEVNNVSPEGLKQESGEEAGAARETGKSRRSGEDTPNINIGSRGATENETSKLHTPKN